MSNSLRPHGLYVAHQAPLPMEFPKQEYWSGLPFPSPGDLSNPGIKLRSPALQADTLPTKPPGKLHIGHYRVSSRIPCAIQKVIHFIYGTHFIYSSVDMSVPISHCIPAPPFLSDNHKIVSYVCDSISILQISSFVPHFFYIPHISDVI